MPNTTVPAAGEAMPKKASDAAVADAMRDLENYIVELDHMTEISSTFLEEMFANPDRQDEVSKTFRFTRREIEQLSFLVNNLADRSVYLHDRFTAACIGEAF